MTQFSIPTQFPKIRVPRGFVLKSLAEDNDLRKIHRVLHIAASGRNQNECKAKGDSEFTTSNLLRVYNDPPQGAYGKL